MRLEGVEALDRAVLGGIRGDKPLVNGVEELILRLMAGLRDGQVSLDLDADEQALLATEFRVCSDANPLMPTRHPLVLSDGRLYLGRYYEDLRNLAVALHGRAATGRAEQPTEGAQSGAGLSPGQAQALAVASVSAITFVTGGPGTGKTRLIQTLVEAMPPGAKALLLAPTGKAATGLPGSERATVATVHRALGLRPGGRRGPRYHAGKPLEADLVVVDEVSMVGLTLLRQLVEAVAPESRLVLVGDKDQLQSVSAGSVLGPLLKKGASEPSASGVLGQVVPLRQTFRFKGALAQLAEATVEGDEDRFFQLLEAGEDGIDWQPIETARALRATVAQSQGQLLFAHRRGPFGSEAANRHLAGKSDGMARPIIIRRNHGELGLFNGDIGSLSGAVARFGDRTLSRGVLPPFESAYALTIHQAQGSEFESVTVVLPPDESLLLSRELLYTAITRSRAGLTLLASEASLRSCLRRPSTAAPGLLELLHRLNDR